MTSLLLQGVLQPLLWLVITRFVGTGPGRIRRWIRACTPEMVWPPAAAASKGTSLSSPLLDDQEGALLNGIESPEHRPSSQPPVQPFVDMMFAKTCFIIAQILSVGLVSPAVAVVGFIAMCVKSTVYLHYMGIQVRQFQGDEEVLGHQPPVLLRAGRA